MVEAICFFLSTILGIVIEYFLKEWLDKITHKKMSSKKGTSQRSLFFCHDQQYALQIYYSQFELENQPIKLLKSIILHAL
mgnify:FL=1